MVEVTVKLNEDVKVMLENFRAYHLNRNKLNIESCEDETIKNALVANYKAIKNADYEFLIQMYLNFQVLF